VEFLLQWDDEAVTRDAALALFDAFASAEKTLDGTWRCPRSRGRVQSASSRGTCSEPALL
jgi:hypothetical protein